MEYLGSTLIGFFKKRVIVLGTSVARNPQQNGFIKNGIKNVFFFARTIMQHAV